MLYLKCNSIENCEKTTAFSGRTVGSKRRFTVTIWQNIYL